MKALMLFLVLTLSSCQQQKIFLTVYSKKYSIPDLIIKEYKNNYNVSIKEFIYNNEKELESLLLMDNKNIDIFIVDSAIIQKHQNSKAFDYLTNTQIPNKININLNFLPLIKEYDTRGISIPFLFDVSGLSNHINNIESKKNVYSLASQVNYINKISDDKNKLNFILPLNKHSVYASAFVINSKSNKKSIAYSFINFCLEPFSQAHIVHRYGIPSFIKNTERFINNKPIISSEELLENCELKQL